MRKENKKIVPATTMASAAASLNNDMRAAEKGTLYVAVTAVVLVIVAILRLRLLTIPLERDEGEYAYVGTLILKGIMPYKEAYTMKLPGTGLMYSLFLALFGKSDVGIHIGLLLINTATSWLLFFSFRRLFHPMVAMIAASSYAMLSFSPAMLGFAAHATQFVSFFVALALLFYAQYTVRQSPIWIFLTGLSLGLSFLMKQQAVFFLLFGGFLWITEKVSSKKKIRSILLYGIGAIAPYLVLLIFVVGSGAWDQFVFWTLTYARAYAGHATLDRGLELLGMSFLPMFKEYFLIWLLFFAGLILIPLSDLTKRQKSFALSFSLAAFLTICPGLFFRSHYFISFLPAVVLMAGLAVQQLVGRSGIRSRILLPASIIGSSLLIAWVNNQNYYLKDDSETIVKNIYGTNPFAESKVIANYVRAHSTASDEIAVIGSEPQIYFYANRKAATGYLYTYGLMEDQPYNKKMAAEMIREIEQKKPAYLVFSKVGLSWLMGPDSPQDIFNWFYTYIEGRYDLAGAADIKEDGPAQFVWDASVKNYRPVSEDFILIFHKKVL